MLITQDDYLIARFTRQQCLIFILFFNSKSFDVHARNIKHFRISIFQG